MWLFLLWVPSFLLGEFPYSIVFVHIGKTLPRHVEIALDQARLFNPECPIILVANENALTDFSSFSNITLVTCESLPLTKEHEEFLKRTKLNDQYLNGFWRYGTERFLYLYDYMAAFGAENVFHIENDVLLYVDVGEFAPIFYENYPTIATTFETDFRCIPGFFFVANGKALQKLAQYFVQKCTKGLTDMHVIAQFWKEHKENIDCLPMIMESYLYENTPKSFENSLLKKKLRHAKHIEKFGSIFDGAAIGVYFDGLDPAKADYPPGYIMKDLFDPSFFIYEWIPDEKGRRVPYASYGTKKFKINNLHIASKRLELFTSKEWPF